MALRKLSDEQAAAIRATAVDGRPLRLIAQLFNVTPQTVWRVVHGQTYQTPSSTGIPKRRKTPMTTMNDDEIAAAREVRLLSTAQVAQRYAVNEDTVRRWCRDKRIPCIKVGTAYRVRLDELERLERWPDA